MYLWGVLWFLHRESFTDFDVRVGLSCQYTNEFVLSYLSWVMLLCDLIGCNRQHLIADWVIPGGKLILKPVSFHGLLRGQINFDLFLLLNSLKSFTVFFLFLFF